MIAGHITVYALIDPRRPEEVRYVGKAQNARTRHLQHCSDSGTTPKGQWVDRIRSEGVLPQMIELENTPEAIGELTEQLWIQRFRPELLLNDAVVKSLASSKSAMTAMRVPQPIVGELLPWQKVERDFMIGLLKKHGGKIAPAAFEMNISRPTFYEKMAKFGIEKLPGTHGAGKPRRKQRSLIKGAWKFAMGEDVPET